MEQRGITHNRAIKMYTNTGEDVLHIIQRTVGSMASSVVSYRLVESLGARLLHGRFGTALEAPASCGSEPCGSESCPVQAPLDPCLPLLFSAGIFTGPSRGSSLCSWPRQCLRSAGRSRPVRSSTYAVWPGRKRPRLLLQAVHCRELRRRATVRPTMRARPRRQARPRASPSHRGDPSRWQTRCVSVRPPLACWRFARQRAGSCSGPNRIARRPSISRMRLRCGWRS